MCAGIKEFDVCTGVIGVGIGENNRSNWRIRDSLQFGAKVDVIVGQFSVDED
jgi:hypothetical protein